MGRGLGRDLIARLHEDHRNGRCTTSTSASDAHRLRNAVRAGYLISPGPQLYAIPMLWSELKPSEREAMRIRSLATLHPQWVFSHYSAAMVYGLSVSHALLGTIHLATKSKVRPRKDASVVRHLITSPGTTTVGNIRVTSLERTVFDCLRTCDFRSALAIADSALHVHKLGADDYFTAFRTFSRSSRGWQRAYDIMLLADGRSESGGESIARAVMLELGFMPPQLQKEAPNLVDQGVGYRVDFYWSLPDGEIYGELDGREKYTNPAMTGGRDAVAVLADERLRESRLSATAAKIMRFSYADVVNTKRFAHILKTFGIPNGYAVPAVADPNDPINQQRRA